MILVRNVPFSGQFFDKNKTMHNEKKYQKLLFEMNFTTFSLRKSTIYKQTQINKKHTGNISSTYENTIYVKYTSTHQDYNAK